MAKIDSLEIEIKTNAKEVVKDIDTLSKSVEKLSKVDTKTLYQNLNSISGVIKNFANDIKVLDTSKLESMANSISKISGSTKKSMQQASKSVSELNKNMANTSGVKKSQQSYEEFMASIKGLGKNQNFFGTSSQLDKEIASTQNKIEKIKTSLEAYNQEGKSVETKGWRTAQRQLEQYSNYLDNLLAKQKQTSSNPTGFEFDEKAIAEHKSNIYKLLLTDEEYQKKRQEILSKMPKVEIPAEVNFDTSKGLEKFKEAVMKTGGSKGIGVDIDSFMDDYANKVTETRKKVDESVQSMANTMKRLTFEPTKLGQGQKYTAEYKTLEKEISKAEKQLEKYLNTQERLDKTGVNTNSQRYKNLTENIDQTDAHLQRLYKDMQMLQSEGKDIINPNQFDVLSEKSKSAQSVMLSLSKALRAGGFGGAASSIQKLGADVGSLSSGLAGAGASAEGASTALVGMQTAIPVIGLILAAVTLLVKAFTSLAKAAINAFKKIVNAIKTVIGKIKDLVSNILAIGTSSYKAHTLVGKFINKMVNMFKSRLLRQAITQAIQYMKQGFKDLDAYSNSIGSPFHRNVAMLVSDLAWLGRSIAAAFEPILNVALPILDFLIDKVVQVINVINQFFSALTGSSTWTKAIKGAGAYENATSGAAKAQKDLNKQIREWDNLNVITDPNKDNGGGGSGSNSGANANAFTTEDVPNSIKKLAEKFKESWNKDADFTWLGTDIGNKVKEVLDGIKWDDKIKPAAEKFGKALATTINGFVEVPGLADTIGTTIAQAINTVMTTFDSFVSWIHGDSIGTFIGELVGSAIDNIEWDKYIHGMGKLGEELAKGINSLAETDVLSKLSKGFANIIKGAIEGAYKFVTNIEWGELGTKIGNSISEFFKTLNEVDENGMSGFEKIGATVKNLKDGLQSLFTNAFKAIDKTEIKAAVANLLKGLIDPEEAKDWFKDNLKESFVKALTGTTIDLGDLKFAFNAGQSIGEKAVEGWQNAKDYLEQNPLPIMTKIQDFVADVKTKFGEIKTWLSTNLLDIALNIKDSASNAIQNIKDSWENWGAKAKELKAKVKGGAKDKIKEIKDAWKNLKGGTKNFTLNLKGGAKSALEKVQKIWDNLSTKAKTLTLNFVNNFTIPLKKAWNSLADSINGFSAKISSKIPKLPKFAGYATGGFPEDGWFRASRGEYFGKFDNGQSVIANNKQIENGLMNTVRMGNADLVSVMSQELSETRKQNELLRQILAKETGINYKDVYKAYQKGAREETWRTGRAY